MNITKSFISTLPEATDKQKFFWDDDVKGFGIRFQGKTKSYIIMYRNTNGRQKMMTLCRIDKLTPDEARKLAKEKLAEVVHGKDPAKEKIEEREAKTIEELCDWYMDEGTSHKKASTLEIDKGRIKRHIKPLLGSQIVKALTRGDIESFMYDIIKGDKIRLVKKSDKRGGVSRVTGGKTAASRTVQLLGAILEFAIRRGIIDHNPAHGIQKPKSNKKDVFLDINDIKSLGLALLEAEKAKEPQSAIDAIKLLLLTGCRKTEILSLKWEYIDLKNKCFRFPDTKTGKQTRPFGQGALNLLCKLKEQSNSPWVFPATRGEGYLIFLPKVFKRTINLINKETEKPFIEKTGVSLHTLRHSFASIAAEMAYSELTIAGLLGHSIGSVTNRYSHLPDPSLINAADKVSLRIEHALSGKNEQENNIIELKRG